MRVLLPPFPRLYEASRPYAALRRFGLVLLGFICLAEASGQSPTLPHQPCIHIGAVRQLAYRDRALVSIGGSLVARQVTSANKTSQLARGDPPTGPGLPICVRADLIRLRRIDPVQANVGARDDDGIAVDYPCFADDGGRRRGSPIFVTVKPECAEDQDAADEPLGFRAA